MTIHYTQGLMPGLDGGLESQDDTVQIGEGNLTGTVTFTLAAPWNGGPRVALSGEITAQSGGSATDHIERLEVTSRTADSIEVTVELDAAPGAGETTTVRVDALFAGEVVK